MNDITRAIHEANRKLNAYLSGETTRLQTVREALSSVGPLLPVKSPTAEEAAALAQYRRHLLELQPALKELTVCLLGRRARVQTKRGKLNVLSVYQGCATL